MLIIIRNDSESPTNQLQVSTLQRSPWLSLQHWAQTARHQWWTLARVWRGWKYHHHPSLSCFPSGTLQTKCTKNRNQHTITYYYVATSMQGWTKIFLHNPHTVIFSTELMWWTRVAASHRGSWVPLGPTTSRCSCGFSSTLYPGKTQFGAESCRGFPCWNGDVSAFAKIHRRYPKVIAEKLGTANIRIRAR